MWRAMKTPSLSLFHGRGKKLFCRNFPTGSTWKKSMLNSCGNKWTSPFTSDSFWKVMREIPTYPDSGFIVIENELIWLLTKSLVELPLAFLILLSWRWYCSLLYSCYRNINHGLFIAGNIIHRLFIDDIAVLYFWLWYIPPHYYF